MSKKWAAKRLTINLTSSEAEKLEKYCSMTGRPATDVIRRANASKLLLITTKNKNQRKNQDFALDYFLSPKAMPAAGYANA
ncbi:hypothetical protein [Nostoc flagelliforme]|nr:hypothetical protein [Nostoc flagelliforme]